MPVLSQQKPLTDAQRELAGQNIRLAYWVASRRLRSAWPLDADEIQSAAHFGLCCAAQGYNPNIGVKFSTYAFRAMHHAIDQEILARNRRKRRAYHPDGRPVLVLSSDMDRYVCASTTDIMRIDAADWMASLPEKERRVMELRLEGKTFRTISTMLGKSPKWSFHIQKQALSRL